MKVIIEIERPTGTVELVDVSERFPNGMSRQLLEAAREATRKAGRGYIRRIVEGEIDQNPKVSGRRFTSAMAYGYRDEEERRHRAMMRQDLEGE